MLEIQYRMHPDIQSFPNKQYYDGVLRCGLEYPPQVIDGIPWPRTQGKRSGTEDTGNLTEEHDPCHRVLYIHCGGQEFNNGRSPCNRMQADAVEYVLGAVHRQYRHPPTVLVPTPYRRQHPLLTRKLAGYNKGRVQVSTIRRWSLGTRGRPRDHQFRQRKRDWECRLQG